MLTLRAHAKINLCLAVGPPEPPGSARPGWHPIASRMSCIDLADDLVLTRLADGIPSICVIAWAADAPRPTPIDWPVEKDLAIRAHGLLERHTGRTLPVELRLTKRIPVGGGLGGGSSDAAAMLTGLNRLFALGLSTPELQGLGAKLGSDVMFFLDEHDPPRPAVVSGFGEQIERGPRTPGDLLLIIPPFGCPTAEVYRAYDRTPARPLHERFSSGLKPGPVLAEASLFNDLLAPARAARPALGELIDRLTAALARPPALTGSGSCLFLPAAGPDLPGLAAAIRAAAPECICIPARLV